MPFDPTHYPHANLTEKIIGAAMAVHRAPSPGLDEKIYENALGIELTAESLSFTQQQQFPVFYRENKAWAGSSPISSSKIKSL